MPTIAALDEKGQTQAARLYESGLSVQQVADQLGVSLKAAFYALRKLGTLRRSSAESNRLRFETQPLSYVIKSRLTPFDERLKLSAVMLYWAEGYKAGENSIDFANSDPAMVGIFTRFLREICGVDATRLRGYLYCYQDQNPNELISFWSVITNIPVKQFTKPYVKQAPTGPRGSACSMALYMFVIVIKSY